MLLMALGDLPYRFYSLLPWVVCGASLLLVFHECELRGKASVWMAFLTGLAVLFNPVFQVSLSRREWMPIDVASSILLMIHYLICERLATTDTSTETDQTWPPEAAHAHRTAREWAALLDREDVLILDTEARGSREARTAEVREVAVIDTTGAERFTAEVAPRLQLRIHGKTVSPSGSRWPDVHAKLAAILDRAQLVLAYNADHDREVLEQTVERYNLTLPPVVWRDAMRDYAEFRGEPWWNGEVKWISLDDAGKQESVLQEPRRRPHRALKDTQILLEVMRAVVNQPTTASTPRAEVPPLTEDEIPF